MIQHRAIEFSNCRGLTEKRSLVELGCPPALLARIEKKNREARAAGLIKDRSLVARPTVLTSVRAVPRPVGSVVVLPETLTAEQAKAAPKALIRTAEDRDVCMCAHCSPDGTPEDEYDDECSTEDCASCRTLARVHAALEL
jgi:hypothetical protein